MDLPNNMEFRKIVVNRVLRLHCSILLAEKGNKQVQSLNNNNNNNSNCYNYYYYYYYYNDFHTFIHFLFYFIFLTQLKENF